MARTKQTNDSNRIGSAQRKVGPAEARYREAVRARMAKGYSGEAAALHVDAWKPDLRRQMLAELKQGRETMPNKQTHEKQLETALGAWRAAVTEKIAQGMSRERALMAVDREAPELRRRYIEACNS